jgi:MerR family transcriptional regulator, light-induced transcriptional regulator
VTGAPPSPTPRYPVRLVALRTGLSPHVLRAWERRYGVVSPTRSEGGQRLYSEHDIERLLRLRRLTERGHSISRLAPLPLGELARLEAETSIPISAAEGLDGVRAGAPAKWAPTRSAAEEAVVEAFQAARRLDTVEIQAVLERAAVTLGVPVFVDRVVAPLLARIGHGWSERTVSVAQEHLASAVVRRVLGWLLRVYEVRDAPRLVVATPPHQAHELGALMAAASAAAEGWSVTYLGPDLPVADLVNAAHQSGAWAVAISAVHQPDGGDLVAALRDTRAGLPADVVLCVGGTGALQVRAEAEAVGARVLESLAEFRAVLAGLAHGRGL